MKHPFKGPYASSKVSSTCLAFPRISPCFFRFSRLPRVQIPGGPLVTWEGVPP